MPESPPFRTVIRDLFPPNLPQSDAQVVFNAVRSFEEAFNSAYFRESILGFNGVPMGFSFNHGLDNAGIFQKLLRAREIDGNRELFTADLYLRFIPGVSPDGTIGYVTHYSRTINTYGYYIHALPHASLAAHFAHEWTHVLDFRHPVHTHGDHEHDATVPYAVENIVRRYLLLKEEGIIG